MAVAEALLWSLGDRLRKARQAAHLEQADLAAAIGRSRATVSAWERDRGEPGASDLVKWATATKTTVSWLVGEQSTSARLSHAPLSLLPPVPGRRYLSPPATPLLGVVKDD